MTGDENGVVSYRATRTSMIASVREAVPAAPGGILRRARPVDHAAVADAILALLPEAEPASLKVSSTSAATIAAQADTIRRLEERLGEKAGEMRGMQAGMADLRRTIAEATEEIRSLGGNYNLALAELEAKDAAVTGLTRRAEDAEASVASLRDDNASLARSVIAAGDALRRIADAPPGTTHAAKTLLAAAGLAALGVAAGAGEVPAGAHDSAEGTAGGFLP